MRYKDLTGQRFNRLVVLEHIVKDDKEHTYWRCLCDCGNETIARSDALKSGAKQSCGCFHKEIMPDILRNVVDTRIKTHGKTKTRLYGVWNSMCSRCYVVTNSAYKNYGGRGIKVCDEWRNNFQAFSDWAMENGYDPNAPKGVCTIDRIDYNKDYSPDNCRFVDMKMQVFNRRKRDSKSGERGITYIEGRDCYRARIGKNNKSIEIGRFRTLDEAIKARKTAEMKYYGMVLDV